jgi:HIRAN domain
MGFRERLRAASRSRDSVSPATPRTPTAEIAVRVVEDTHTFYGDDASTWWSSGYAPIADDGHFLTLAEHATSDPRVLYCAIAGAKHRPAALQDARFQPLSEVLLRPEPDNPHDPNAVGVWDKSGTLQIGYVPADLSAKVAAQFRANQPLSGLILREIRQDSKRGPRVSLHMLVAPLGAVSLAVVSDPRSA